MSDGNISHTNKSDLSFQILSFTVSCNRTSARRLIYLKREFPEPHLEIFLNLVYRLYEEIDKILIWK